MSAPPKRGHIEVERGGITLDVDLERLKLGVPASSWGSDAYEAVPLYSPSRDTPPALFKIVSDMRRELSVGTSPVAGRVKVSTMAEMTGIRDPVMNILPVLSFRLGDPSAGPVRRALVISGIHAREWYSQEVALLLATRLFALCRSDRRVSEYPGMSSVNVEVVVVPVVNLFGYFYTLAGPNKAVRLVTPQSEIDAKIRGLEGLWGTGFKNKIATGRAACRGNRKVGPWMTDLNRNFPVFWGDKIGASECPLSDDYFGTGPASEIETQAVIALVKSLGPELVVDLHSFGDDVLEPGGMNPRLLDKDKESVRLSRWLAQLAPGMLLRLGPDYKPRYLYPCTGSLEDWVLFETDAACLTLELGYKSFAADDIRGESNKLALPSRMLQLMEVFFGPRPRDAGQIQK